MTWELERNAKAAAGIAAIAALLWRPSGSARNCTTRAIEAALCDEEDALTALMMH